jgi:hypothetical protein
MSQPENANPEKRGTNLAPQPQTPPQTVKPIAFDDLVVDRSLAAVKVRLRPAASELIERKTPSGPDDELLTELQCEV